MKKYKWEILGGGAVILIAVMAVLATGTSETGWAKRLEKNIIGSYGGNESQFVFFKPINSTEKLPLIIFIHSGAFVVGKYNDFLITSMAKDFARAGFATASIEYPKITSDIGGVLVHKREMEAVASAKKSAYYFSENSDDYGIDANKIFVCGYSAGAIIALHSLFTDANDAKEYAAPDPSDQVLQTLDRPNPFKAIIAISGGVLDMSHIEDADFSCPILMIHGRNDKIFPLNVGKPFDEYIKDYSVDIPGLAFELAIGDEMNLKTGTSLNLPENFASLIQAAFLSDVYGSEAIYSQYRKISEVDLIKLRKGHNLFLTKKGEFSKTYFRIRKKIRSFINKQLDEK